MSFLAGIVLAHCDEAEAFICFTNWVHSNYFIKLFRGYLQDIKLRVDLFDQYFRKMLPELHAHFVALEIETAFFPYRLDAYRFCKESRLQNCVSPLGQPDLRRRGIRLANWTSDPDILRINVPQAVPLLDQENTKQYVGAD